MKHALTRTFQKYFCLSMDCDASHAHMCPLFRFAHMRCVYTFVSFPLPLFFPYHFSSHNHHHSCVDWTLLIKRLSQIVHHLHHHHAVRQCTKLQNEHLTLAVGSGQIVPYAHRRAQAHKRRQAKNERADTLLVLRRKLTPSLQPAGKHCAIGSKEHNKTATIAVEPMVISFFRVIHHQH